MFVPSEPFQPTEPSQVKHLLGSPLKGRLLASSTKVRLGWKVNYGSKMFLVQAPGEAISFTVLKRKRKHGTYYETQHTTLIKLGNTNFLCCYNFPIYLILGPLVGAKAPSVDF